MTDKKTIEIDVPHSAAERFARLSRIAEGDIRYLKQRIAILEDANVKQSDYIMELERRTAPPKPSDAPEPKGGDEIDDRTKHQNPAVDTSPAVKGRAISPDVEQMAREEASNLVNVAYWRVSNEDQTWDQVQAAYEKRLLDYAHACQALQREKDANIAADYEFSKFEGPAEWATRKIVAYKLAAAIRSQGVSK
jgi:hypothetical protein